MKRYTTVIFDLDGTLLDTLADLADGVNIALRLHGFPEHTTEEVCMAVGSGVVRLMEQMVPGGKDNPDFEPCLADFRREYAKIAQNKTCPYAGIPELLEHLAAAGLRMAVVSNKFHGAVVDLVRHYFPIIPVAAGEREAEGIRKKPAPDTVLWVMQQFGVTAEECVYIGDSDVDIATAKNASMDCISVTWGFRDRAFLAAHGASVYADTPAELEKLLLKKD
ncbi:MAG: HAD-IIIA family hydrolase [Clostridia bacterium]|nr:HAD-IIIA family hydrolase [Clostridia bacterium]